MNLSDTQNFFVSNEQKEDLKALRDNKAWQTFKQVAEGSLLKWTSNLLVGTELEPGARARQLEQLSGFVYFWSKLKAVVDSKNENEEESNEEES